MKYPLITIAIATYNSEKTLSLVLDSIKKQSYPKGKIEVLIIDGNSKDTTISITKKYKSKIFNNPKVDQVYAKNMAYKLAKGKYLIFLDSDEELNNKDSLKMKLNVFQEDSKIKSITTSGYVTPESYPEINTYINEYGDPFSLFMYKSSRDYNFFIKDMKTKYKRKYENKNVIVFDFSTEDNPPFIELTSMGVMIDLDYVRKNLPEVLRNIPTHTHLFYLLNSMGNYFAITKNDSVTHYSAVSIKKYLKKLSSRIKSNIFGTSMGHAGFKGREVYTNKDYKLKKLFFILYTLTLILPIYDSIQLFLSRKKTIYLWHPFLCLYVLCVLIYYFVLKTINAKVKLSGYGT